jgi:NADH-quinone oxidoreductase subunit E
MNLKPQSLAKIDQLIPRYPEKRSAVLPLLHLIQEEHGWISNEAIEWVAGKLDLQPINVYEVVTFYPMFKQQPGGKYAIKVCRTLSCALGGAYKTCKAFQQALDCEVDGISPDGLASIEFVECHANCGKAPVVMIEEQMFEGVDENAARALVADMRAGKIKPAREIE